MADEITITSGIVANKGGAYATSWPQSGNVKVTMAGDDVFQGTQTIGTSDEAIVLGDIGTLGYYWIKNLDTTNYVELSHATGGSFAASRFAKISAGKTHGPVEAFSSTIYAKANTAACIIFTVAAEA